MLAQGEDITGDADVTAGALQSPKAAGGFPAHFNHAERSFAFIVGEGHFEMVQKGEDAVLVTLQPIQ